MTALIITHVGQQNGSPRIWMEGRKLEREGFAPDTLYRIKTTYSDRLVLIKEKSGTRKVSARKQKKYRKPIIDIANLKLLRWFKEDQKLRIVIRRGRITIRAHVSKARVEARESRLKNKIARGNP
jgi:DNA (cytosine-5)-methyltransferase 1